MREYAPPQAKRVRTVLVIGLACPFLIACGESNNNTPAKVDLRPQVSAFVAIRQLAQRADGTPPDRPEDLKGEDADNNGIRDDVDAYIAQQNYTPKQKKAVQQYARAIQKDILSDASDRDISMERAKASARAVNCLGDLDTPQDRLFSYNVVQIYLKLISNTPGRARADSALDHALSGRSWEMPSGDTCED